MSRTGKRQYPRRWRRPLLTITAVLLACEPLTLSGQESNAPPPSKVERKNLAPVSPDTLLVKLPRPIEAKLANGLQVLILEDHRLPMVFSEFHIRGAGSLFDPEHLPGLASATAQMLREGTQGLSSREIAERLDRLGASAGGGSGSGSVQTVFSASGLSENFDEWFALAVEILLRPGFPSGELEQLKERAKVQLRQQRASAGFLAGERFNQAVYGSHPAATVAATLESIDALTPELLSSWHQERYLPDDTILAFAGDVRPAELLAKLEKSVGTWNGPHRRVELPPHPTPLPSRKVYLVDRPGSVQTTLTLGNIAIDRRSEDFIPMVVMNQVLGGGPAGRLFLNLREEKGYTYGAYSSFTAVEYPGPWSAGADVRTEVTEGALTEFLNEIRRIREEEVGRRELGAAKRSVVASFALALEQPARVLGFALTRKFYNLPDDYWDAYPAKVDAVTPADVQRVARKYLNLESIQIVAVGDGSKLKPVLEKFGALEVFDATGKRIS